MGTGKQINEILAKDEIIEYQTSERLIQSFIEQWNDRNPKHKLDKSMIDFIRDYLRIAYVSGWDDHRILVDKFLNGPGLSVNKHFFMKWLNELEDKI